MKFFVEIDRDTLKRVVVEPLEGRHYTVTTSLLSDAGTETRISVDAIQGELPLERRLLREGIGIDAIHEAFGADTHGPGRNWAISAASLAASLVVVGAVVLIPGCS